MYTVKEVLETQFYNAPHQKNRYYYINLDVLKCKESLALFNPSALTEAYISQVTIT